VTDNECKDGFRPRRKRPKGWLTKAIKDGSVRDPHAPYEPEPRPTDGAVFDVPLIVADAEQKEPR